MSGTSESQSATERAARTALRHAESESAAMLSPKTSEAANDSQPVLGMADGDRRVLLILVCLAFVLMSLHWYRLTQSRPEPIQVLHSDDYVFELEVNTATWVEWMQLDRIGETLARRIVADRQQNGPFQSVDDVQRVSGVGPKTISALRGQLTCRAPLEVKEELSQ